jgi:ketosteroid isomerase-like protein
MTHDEIDALATRFFDAVQAGDIDAVAALYADDCVVWHNYDQVEQGKADNLRTLSYVTRHVSGRSYDDIARVVVDDGFIQQHVLRGTTAGGPLEVPAMMRVWADDGKITRLDEYLDTAQVAVIGVRA